MVKELAAVVIAAQSIAWPPALTLMVPLFVNEMAVFAELTRTASVLTEVMVPVFEIVSEELFTVLSIARPVEVCWIVPLFVSEVVALIVTATVAPPRVRDLPASTVPVCPLVSSVCALVELELMTKVAA
ncbi:MAG: hypothetical protein NTY98_20455 [Verrucomicrobia bacterium]|nr:hypothetical protein [Verrucomicrobiota bacterium]